MLKGDKGSMLLETVLVMPLLYVLIMAVLQIAHIWTARQVALYAAYAATRATLCVAPAEAQKTARSAAWQVCSLLTISGNSLKMEDEQLSVKIDNGTALANRLGNSVGTSGTTLRYKFPLVMPVVGRFFADGTLTFDGHVMPYIEFTERCVLPMRYSTAAFPRTLYGTIERRDTL